MTYFRRALKLNQHFLSAWTLMGHECVVSIIALESKLLMGHEYVELKNTSLLTNYVFTDYSHSCLLWLHLLWLHLTRYVELKNTAAAVDAYRHAVDINAKDYRAWYGLGQP